MEHSFWSERWTEGRIGFHQPGGHPFLPDLLKGTPPGRALVPLAGKTVDILTLHQHGHDVVAVEFVEQAVRAFAEEQEVPLTMRIGPLGPEFVGDRLRIMAADFFEAKPDVIGRFDVAYDRASLVALPREDRPRYADHLRELMWPGGQIWTFTFEYDESKMSGPPFSVPVATLEALYPGTRVELVREVDIIGKAQRFSDQGLTSFMERVHRIHV